jgi:predicted dehydrogenase
MAAARRTAGSPSMASSPVSAVLCGAGVRGHFVYGAYALRHPRRLRFVAVAEPDGARRRRFQRAHAIPDSLAFARWEDLLAVRRRAQAAFVCGPDTAHAAPALRALESGYDLLLEKPMSPLPEECCALAAFPLAEGQRAQVAHVLRYTDFWRRVKETVAAGRIGRVVHFELSENVSTWHFGHSYVRGAYGVERLSSPLILAKCCHDLDLVGWILGEQARSVQSTAGLLHYRPENAPPGAPERCTDGCPAQDACPWFAPRLYLRGEPILRTLGRARSPGLRGLVRLGRALPGPFRLLGAAFPALRLLSDWDEFPSTALGVDLSREGKLRALREGPFGRCVYRCGNDVPDHQQVLLDFPSGATASLTVHGLSEFEGRELRVFGTRGVLRGVFRLQEEELCLTDHRRLATERLHRSGAVLGHGGGDAGLLDAFTAAPSGGAGAARRGELSGPAEALESHLLAFAAEASRRRGAAVRMEEYRGAPYA